MANYRRNLKNAVSKVSSKTSMGRVPTKMFVKINFEVEDPKIDVLGFFLKIDPRNFCELGKNVIFEFPIFLKNRGNGSYFSGCAPKCSSHESHTFKILRD